MYKISKIMTHNYINNDRKYWDNLTQGQRMYQKACVMGLDN